MKPVSLMDPVHDAFINRDVQHQLPLARVLMHDTLEHFRENGQENEKHTQEQGNASTTSSHYGRSFRQQAQVTRAIYPRPAPPLLHAHRDPVASAVEVSFRIPTRHHHRLRPSLSVARAHTS